MARWTVRRPGHDNLPPFDVSACAQDDGEWLVTVRGELDLFSSPRLREALAEVVAAGPRRLTIDLTGVTELDSSGLTVLVQAHRRLSPNGGEVRVMVADEDTYLKFSLTGLDQILEVSVDGAPARLGRVRAVRPRRGGEGGRPAAR